jgi:hypothetical protein
MKQWQDGNKLVTLASAALAGVSVTAQAQTVDLALSDYSSQAISQNAGSYNGVPMGDGQIGIYQFTVSDSTAPSLNNGSTIYSICLSPLGDLTTQDPQPYNSQTFAHANSGLNPALWTWNGLSGSAAEYWGIQNANYLWRSVANGGGPGVGALSADQSAALALAMYTMLYNSTGYGAFATSGSQAPYAPSFNDPTEQAAYNADLASVTVNAVDANISAGYILVPNDPNPAGPTGQEFIYTNPNGTKFNPPIPEPATMIAGVLMAAPFGTSAARGLRRKFIA